MRTLVFAVALAAASSSLASVDPADIKAIKAATVFIRVDVRPSPASGSGFLAFKETGSGLVVTNAHVVRNAVDHRVEVVFDSGTSKERMLSAQVLVEDRASDLAVLRVQDRHLPEPAVLGDSDSVVETNELYIVGFPFGETFATNRDTPTVTVGKGTVSSLRLDVNDNPLLLQIDGDINPGNSGGPVIGASGEVIGVSVATVRQTNIGFAIPVRSVKELMAGIVGNLRVVKMADRIQLIGDYLDPFGRKPDVRLLYGLASSIRSPGIDASGRWQPITGGVVTAPLTSSGDGRVMASIPTAGLQQDSQSWLAQIALITPAGERYLPPVHVSAAELRASIKGPNTLAEEEPSESLADLGHDGETRDDEAVIEEVFLASGVAATIDRMAREPTLFFGRESRRTSTNDQADRETEQEKDIKERLHEAMGERWTRERLHRHYVSAFVDSIDRAKARTVVQMFNLPAVRRAHVDFLSLSSQGDSGLDDAVKVYWKQSPATRKRLKLFRRLDKARGLSEALSNNDRISKLAVARLVNELVPTAMRKSDANLERDVEAAAGKTRQQFELGVKVLLLQYYADASDALLEEYVEIIETDAFRWFSARESAAFNSMIALRYSEAESDLREVFRDVQRETFGVDKVNVAEDSTPEQAVTDVVEAYGSELVVKYLIAKGDGRVTTDDNGAMRLAYGRPRKELITGASILADLERFGISVDQFTADMEERAIAAGMADRRLQRYVPRRTRLGRSATGRSYSSGSRRSVESYCTETCARRFNACTDFLRESNDDVCYREADACLKICRK